MCILVTGSYGQLGGELCRMLGDRAMGIDVDSLDLTDAEAMAANLHQWRPRAIVNCAAYTQVDKAEEEPQKCRAVNVAAVENLVKVCRELDCPLVQISTDYVFGVAPASHRPWREDDPPQPRGVYARTKFDGERAAAQWAKHLIVRTCGLYARASDKRASNFVHTMLRLGETKSELRVVDDQHCTPTYVPHLARAVIYLLDEGGANVPWGTYHVTNGGETTWRELAVEIFRLAGMNVSVRPISTAEYGASAPRPAYSVLDTGAYHRLGGPPMPDWKTALREYFCEAASGKNNTPLARLRERGWG